MSQRGSGRPLLFLLGALLLAIPLRAGTFTAFGPAEVRRGSGAPETVRQTFAIRFPDAAYRLRLVNGGVTSAVVALNGAQIIGAGDFNAGARGTIEKAITVAATNELTVELRGNPGSAVTISIVGEDDTAPTITATVSPSPNAAGWNRDHVTVTFACADVGTEIASCSEPVTLTTESASHVVTGTATDLAGNTATKSVTVKIDKTPGEITIATPADGAALAATQATLSGSATDALAGVASLTCNGVAATLTGNAFTCAVALTDGENDVLLRVVDAAGNDTYRNLALRSDTKAPAIAIAAPAQDLVTNVNMLTISGEVADDDRVAELTVGGAPATLTGKQFSATVALTSGVNAIEIAANDRAGNRGTATLRATRYAVPSVAITAPADLATVRDAVVTISGTVAGAASVTVNGIAASIAGSTFTATGVALAQGRTVVTALASGDDGAAASDSILVYRDSIAPRVVLRYPLDGTTVFTSAIDVTGMLDDIVVGTINSGQVRVTVNGVAATVANRAFVAKNVVLTPGVNQLAVVATDQGGNAVTVHSRVTYDATAKAKIVMVSGNGQMAPIGVPLGNALTVKLLNADGTPAAGQLVGFEVLENNGTLTSNGVTSRVVTATSAANGEASVRWTLGTHAGAGNNRIVALANGFAGAVEFHATAQSGAPSLIVVDTGNAQYGAVGAPLPRPLIVAVVDAGSNRVAGVPVTFTAAGGGGSFDGQSSVTVTTDSDGRAWATPMLGQDSEQTFRASFEGATKPATFLAFGKTAGPPSETRISGVVLDNTDTPIPGVSLRVDGTSLVVQSDDQGQFTIEAAPVGYVKLLVDGSTARRPGTWPTLEYAMFTIAGAKNTLEMPIYLLPIDVRRGLFVDETNGGTLTIPELPGFALTVKPGSALFPGGGRTGTISVTLVHADKVPMAPGFGQQPRFIVTIQPPGVHFDPPAPIVFPNVDGLAAGAVTEMYSFDHDLGQFVSIGTASVSQDGSVLASDDGVGIIKGGWHCGGDPAASGTTADCPDCQLCIGDECQRYTGHNRRSEHPDHFCCAGAGYNRTVQCCTPEREVVFMSPFRGVDECPDYRPNPDWVFQYDSCTVVGDNPAGGSDTHFSRAPQHDLPCDEHDRCYQTCNPFGRDACDAALLAGMMAVCNATRDGAEMREQCVGTAHSVWMGVRLGGLGPFNRRQAQVCLCC